MLYLDARKYGMSATRVLLSAALRAYRGQGAVEVEGATSSVT
jgi:hypothetical protein